MTGIPPTLVLAVLVGALHASLSLLLRGDLRGHLVAVLPCAIVGAIAGAAAGLRAPEAVRIGDLAVLWASAGAWLGIGLAWPLRRIARGLRASGAPRPPRGTEPPADGSPRVRLPRPRLPRRKAAGPGDEA